MSFIGGVWLVLLGVLGAASLITARRPDTRGLIDRLAPYQGWIGALSVIWGVVEVVAALLDATLVRVRPLAWLVWLVDGLLLVSLGLLLGAGVIKSFVASAAVHERIDRVNLRLVPYQAGLGVAAIVVGLWGVITSVFYRL